MASWIDSDGQAVAPPLDRSKARGQTLSLERCIRLRDLLLAMLVWVLGLSKADAVAVLSLGTISERHARRRLKECPANMTAIFNALRRETGNL